MRMAFAENIWTSQWLLSVRRPAINGARSFREYMIETVTWLCNDIILNVKCVFFNLWQGKNSQDYSLVCRGYEKSKTQRIKALLALDENVLTEKQMLEALKDQKNLIKLLRSLPFRLCIGVTAGHRLHFFKN